jgi:hypothetical protein
MDEHEHEHVFEHEDDVVDVFVDVLVIVLLLVLGFRIAVAPAGYRRLPKRPLQMVGSPPRRRACPP